MRTQKNSTGLYNGKVVIITLSLWILAIFIYIAYHFLGHSLVSKVYHGDSFSFLNATMEGRSIYGLEHYLRAADGWVHEILNIILVCSFVPAFYMVLRKIAFFLSETRFFIIESNHQFSVTSENNDSVSFARLVGFFFITFLISVTPVFFCKYPPLLDYPWHLTRIFILDSWSTSPFIQDFYNINTLILPNTGLDLMALLLAKVLPVETAGRVFIAIVFAITLSGVIFLNRVLSNRFALWPLLSSLFLFNWILLFGFLNYLLGIGLLLWAIGGWLTIRDSSAWLRFFIGSICTLILFFCHLAALGLYAVTIAGYELQRSCKTIRKSEWFAVRDLIIGAAIFIPPTVLFYISSTSGYGVSKFIYDQPWLFKKIVTFLQALTTSNWFLDTSMIFMLALFVVFIKFQGKIQVDRSMYLPLVLLMLAYLILPIAGLFTGGYIDTRIPIAIVYIFIGSSHLTIQRKVWRRSIQYFFFIVLIIRSIFLSYDWYRHNDIIEEYTTAFARMKSGSIMFVVTGSSEPTLSSSRHQWRPPVWHLGSLATLKQKVFVPVIWAHPAKQPITVTKKFNAIKEFQTNDPLGVRSSDDLTDVLNQIRSLVFDVDIPIESVFLLVIDPGNMVEDVSCQVELVASGYRFNLFNLSEKKVRIP